MEQVPRPVARTWLPTGLGSSIQRPAQLSGPRGPGLQHSPPRPPPPPPLGPLVSGTGSDVTNKNQSPSGPGLAPRGSR